MQEGDSYFSHPPLECADLQGLIASGRAALQFPENVATAPFRIGHQPGDDLLPLSCKRVFVGMAPTQDPFSPLLLSVQSVDPCFQIGSSSLGENASRCTLLHRKDADRGRGDGRYHRRATDGTAEHGMLQLPELVQ